MRQLRRVVRPLLWLTALAWPALLPAQNGFTRVANRLVSVTADIALARAVPLDLSTRGPAPVPYGALLVTVPRLDVVDGVVLRVHVAFYNPTEAPVSETVPGDSAFVMVDPTGVRFTLASVRSKQVRATTPDAAATFTVPALERVEMALVFLPNKSAASEAVLKIGSTLLRGVPIRKDVPPAGAPPHLP